VGALFCEACGAKLNVAPSVDPAISTRDSSLPASNVQIAAPKVNDINNSSSPVREMCQTVRGRILRDTNNGIGLLSVDGRQLPFSLEANWLGNIAPVTQMNVDVAIDGTGNVVTVMPVSDKDIAQEKLKAISGDLSSKLQDQIPLMKGYANAVGIPVLVATALLVVSWVWLSLISVRVSASVSQSVTMFDALGLVNMGASLENFGRGGTGSSGIYGFICVLAMLAPLVPTFIKHRFINFCYFAPLAFAAIFAIIAFIKLRSYANVARESMGAFGNSAQMSNMMNAMMDQIMAALSIGFGTYLSVAVALYLAAHGGMKILANR
jgi:hypothetical protein